MESSGTDPREAALGKHRGLLQLGLLAQGGGEGEEEPLRSSPGTAPLFPGCWKSGGFPAELERPGHFSHAMAGGNNT